MKYRSIIWLSIPPGKVLGYHLQNPVVDRDRVLFPTPLSNDYPRWRRAKRMNGTLQGWFFTQFSLRFLLTTVLDFPEISKISDPNSNTYIQLFSFSGQIRKDEHEFYKKLIENYLLCRNKAIKRKWFWWILILSQNFSRHFLTFSELTKLTFCSRVLKLFSPSEK